jgi:hypothetical protein
MAKQIFTLTNDWQQVSGEGQPASFWLTSGSHAYLDHSDTSDGSDCDLTTAIEIHRGADSSEIRRFLPDNLQDKVFARKGCSETSILVVNTN